MLTRRVKEILAGYTSENPGTLANLARILDHGRLGRTGRLVILPVDEGFAHGPARSFAPNDPAYDPAYHFELAVELVVSLVAVIQLGCVLLTDERNARLTLLGESLGRFWTFASETTPFRFSDWPSPDAGGGYS
jgi:hypothetical protein